MANTVSSPEKSQSLKKLMLAHFLQHKLAVAGFICILFLSSVALFVDGIAKITGLDPDRQNITHRYLPPLSRAVASTDQIESQIEQFLNLHRDQALAIGQALLQTGKLSTTDPEEALFEVARLSTSDAIAAEVLLKDLQKNPQISESLPLYTKSFQSMSTFHLFGTDELGRDVLIRLIYGTRVSLGVGVLVALASALIGLLIGSLAGYFGGVLDIVLMRVTDALLSLPTIPVLIIMAAIDLSKLPALKSFISAGNESIYKMVFILCLFSWMTVALLVRGSILSLKEQDFILAARTLGATDFTIILRHIFPNVLAPILVSITLGVGESILFEAALSFLGLGIMPPTASWGNMLNNAQELIYQAPFLALLPGVMILITTISFNFIGDGLQAALDPKSLQR
ncbi:MAG: ABC transporter permease [Pseudobdellovibrionaceae bacterium]